MKKSLVVLLAVVILLSSFTIGAGAASKVTMYSPFGETATVWDYEVKSWQNVGWFTYPVTYVAKPGSSPILIRLDEVFKYGERGYLPALYQKNNVIVSLYSASIDYGTDSYADSAYVGLLVSNLRSENLYIEPRDTAINNKSVSAYCSPSKIPAGTSQIVKINYNSLNGLSRYSYSKKLSYNFKLWTSNGKVNERSTYGTPWYVDSWKEYTY